MKKGRGNMKTKYIVGFYSRALRWGASYSRISDIL